MQWDTTADLNALVAAGVDADVIQSLVSVVSSDE